MEKKTTFLFFGKLALDFPELCESAREMAFGNAMAWINTGIKAFDSMGSIVKLCLDKNNTKLLKNEIDRFEETEEENREKLEQEFLMRKLNDINALKKDFEKGRKEMQKKYNEEKEEAYGQQLEERKALSNIMADMRAGLKEMIDLYDNRIKQIVKEGNFPQEEKRNMEDCKRLLIQQFKKNIDI